MKALPATLLCALLLDSTPCGAQEPASARNAVSFKPLALTARGMTLQYERLLARRFSVAGGAGIRFAAQADYSSFTGVALGEARWWFLGREPIAKFRGMGGPFLGFVLDAGRTSLSNRRTGRDLGSAWTLKESSRVGYRVVFAGLQEVTVAFAADVVHEFDGRGRLAPNTYVTAGMDLTVGWVF